ncbi:DUF4175 domain-containing protein [Hymenobacter sp. NBH84]|uniref:DUF4175 family protein n=1 Tax=Hymenobacter sp. NBH84 TaxID=2596915 RepID=UPI0016279603|nr:DUF4175 family protein [Hymenobacter sp. NBH84]QNE41454.1 DUF4175 domain-containing protein [Hymenobacter sp. NBH84]
MSISVTSAAVEPGLLRRVARSYASRRTVQILLPFLAASGAALVTAERWPQAGPALLVLLAVGVIALVVWLIRLWQFQPEPLARRLDREFAELEDSTGLLLRPTPDLNLLEQLQQQHVAERLDALTATTPALLHTPWRTSLLLTGLFLVVAGVCWFLPSPAAQPVATVATAPVVPLRFVGKPAPAKAPRIQELKLLVTPPVYTRRAGFAAAQPSFQAPAGSRVRWRVRVSRRAAAPVLELGKQRVPLRPVADDSLAFEAEQVVNSSVLYRLRFAGQTSEDYAIEVIPDRAPTLQLITPKPYTLVEFGQKPQVGVRVTVRDDYGLSRARLVATVAKGEGEAVKFTEVATDLSAQLRGQPTQHQLTYTLQLRQLGLTYGDEVYFYVQAWDNHRQMARTDTYLVQWEDTTIDASGADISLGVNVVPAYFRSQRQVIIDTEKLLLERKGLDQSTFASRANDIGHDQKVLRMRYGKFMGEEFEESIGQANALPEGEKEEHHEGDGHDHGHEHGAPSTNANPSSLETTAALMDPYMHKHDDAETADFLEPAVKAKLSVVLSQMWEAELRLRTARPAEALPYEYKALRLLKEVQQQTRVYVKKAGYTPPPMPEATVRLTGELEGAATPQRRADVAAPASQPAVRAALGLLSRLRRGQSAASADAALLDRAGPPLAQAALQRPGAYLTALRDLRQLSAALRAGQPVPCPDCLPVVERALTALLPTPTSAPTPAPAPNRLARRYLQALGQP